MNKFKLLPFFLLLFFSAKAQDRIITTNKDTIHCTIVSISNERILYELKNNDGSVTGKFIPLSQVAEYTNTHQQGNDSKMHNPETSTPEYFPDIPLCVGLNAGYSTMPGYLDFFQSSSPLPDYYTRLKKGFHINASAYYMFKSYLGFGAEYSFFKSATTGSVQTEYSPAVFLTESEKTRQYANYLGASVLLQQQAVAHQKFIVSESLSAGVLFFRMEDQSTYPVASQTGYSDITNNLLFTGKSFSAKFGLSAEYRLFESVSAGVGANYIWCSLKRASFKSKGSDNYFSSSENQKLTNAMKLSRIDYSFVLRYYF